MSLLLDTAKGLERRAGARAGLRAYRALAKRRKGDAALANLAALRCAAELDERELFAELLALWSTQRGAHTERLCALALRLARAAKVDRARELTTAERRRLHAAPPKHREEGEAWAGLLYLAAALVPSTTEKSALYTQLSEAQGPLRWTPPLLQHKSRLRLAELAQAAQQSFRAARLAQSTDPAELEPQERLRRATLLLLSGSRFTRAEGFSEFAEQVASAPADAIACTVRGLVRRLPQLSSLERDRVRAVFSRIPDEPGAAVPEAKRQRWSELCEQLLAHSESAPPTEPVTAEPAAGEPALEPAPGARSAYDLQWLHVTLFELAERLSRADEHERAPLEDRLASLLSSGAQPRFGFSPLLTAVHDRALRVDLAIRADAAKEPGARAQLLVLAELEVDTALAAADFTRAHAMAELCARLERGGDATELYEWLSNSQIRA